MTIPMTTGMMTGIWTVHESGRRRGYGLRPGPGLDMEMDLDFDFKSHPNLERNHDEVRLGGPIRELPLRMAA